MYNAFDMQIKAGTLNILMLRQATWRMRNIEHMFLKIFFPSSRKYFYVFHNSFYNSIELLQSVQQNVCCTPLQAKFELSEI